MKADTQMKRFDPICRPYTKAMIIDDLGNYVLYSDYEKLESEKKELIEGIKKAINTLPCEKALLSLYPDSEENEALIKAIEQLNILIN